MDSFLVTRKASVQISADDEIHHRLNRLWGYENGLVPLDVTGPSAHRDAANRVSWIRTVTVTLTLRVHKDGNIDVEAVDRG